MALDSRITIHKLEVFKHVVELGSVSRAAERLFVSQPVVTTHIRSLEERLRTRLFYREGRKLHLTDAGRAVDAWATDILRRTRELDRHLENLSDGRQGAVVVGASMAVGCYLLPPVLAQFRAERPLVEIRLNILDSEHAFADTLAGENDFAIAVSQTDPGSEILTAERLGAEELIFVCNPDSPLAGRTITIEELAVLPFVEAPRGLTRRAFVDAEMQKLGIYERAIAIELGHAEAMKEATRAGLGIAVLSRTSVATELARGEFGELDVEGVELGAPVYLVYRKDKLFTRVHVDLMETLRSVFASKAAVVGA